MSGHSNQKTNEPRYREIDGELCANHSLAMQIFIAHGSLMQRWRADGMPHYKIGRCVYYPIERCHAWFRGEIDNAGVS